MRARSSIESSKFVLGVATVLGLVGLYFLHSRATFLFVLAQGNCCSNVPLQHPSIPRFPQGARVTVYIDSSPSGFTSAEQQLIKSGIEDWNNEPNNSGVTYDVKITSSPPPAGTNNTILVQFNDQFSSGTGGVLLNLHSSSGPGGTSIYAEMIFFNNIRNPQRAESKPEQIRTGARHEIAHGIGLANASNCPPGSTIMNPSWVAETFITACDNSAINTDPVYPPTSSPTATPTPEPTPCAGEFAYCAYPQDCCPGLTCGEITLRCIPCEIDNNNPQGGCMTESCVNCYNGEGTYCDPWSSGCWTPIIVDVEGDGFDLTGVDDGIRFDGFGHGVAIKTAWTNANSDDAWLVLDRNGNGTIDDGTELFSSAAPQPELPAPQIRHGFNALVQYDKSENGGNGDGVLNNEDSIFNSLQLWQDKNHNGISETSELFTLNQLGLSSIDMDYRLSRRKDRHGNVFKFRARVTDTRGAQLGRWAYDVFPVARP